MKLLLGLLLVVLAGCGQSEALHVYLRCPLEPLAGKIDIQGESFFIRDACRKSELEFRSYQQDRPLLVRIRRDDGSTAEATAIYGENVHRDHNGFHVIFKIQNEAPLIQNDKL